VRSCAGRFAIASWRAELDSQKKELAIILVPVTDKPVYRDQSRGITSGLPVIRSQSSEVDAWIRSTFAAGLEVHGIRQWDYNS
jgi:hypothetical protein